MKSKLSLVLVVAMVVALSSCGAKKTEASTADTVKMDTVKVMAADTTKAATDTTKAK